MRDAVWQVPSRTFDVVPNFIEKKMCRLCLRLRFLFGSVEFTKSDISSSPIPGFQIFLERVRTKNSSKTWGPSLFGPDVSGEIRIAFSNPQGSQGGPIFTTWRPPKSLGATWPWSPSFRWCRGSCALPGPRSWECEMSLSTHRIHGAAIYCSMDPINIPQSC